MKRRRSLAAWLGLFALVLPMLAPMAQGLPLAVSDTGDGPPFYTVLCKAMQAGTDGSGAPGGNPDLLECPICLSQNISAPLYVPASTELLPPRFRSAAYPPEIGGHAPGNRAVHGLRARAPPPAV